MTATTLARPPAGPAAAETFDVTVETEWARIADAWRPVLTEAAATPFQSFAWLDAWYREIAPAAGATPRLVTVRDRASGGPVMLLPLAMQGGRFGPVLQFADEELTDFNAPILGPVDVAQGAERTLWRALAAALGRDHIAASLRKMPTHLRGRRNPLAILAGAQTSRVASNAIALEGTFADYHARLERRVRMELERCWRVLNREADVSFTAVETAEEASRVLAALDQQQRERLDSAFTLDEPAQSRFYRHDLVGRLARGDVHLTSLSVRGEIIAALYAVADRHTAVVLRISNAGQAWSKVSPGRLIVHKSIEHFYQRGLAICDLSIGDYDYKRRFGVVRTPLVDLVAPLSWRGTPMAARHWAVGTVRAHPDLERRLRDMARGLGLTTANGPTLAPAGHRAG